MKNLSRLVAIIVLIFVAGFTARADRHIDEAELPAGAKSFIEKYYTSVGLRECEVDDGYYEIELRNGVDLVFDADGNLKKIDADNKKVSGEILKNILPVKAYDELDARKVLDKVEKVEFKSRVIKVETSEWFDDEYRFDKDGRLLSVSD